MRQESANVRDKAVDSVSGHAYKKSLKGGDTMAKKAAKKVAKKATAKKAKK
jgi:hypothetical protein